MVFKGTRNIILLFKTTLMTIVNNNNNIETKNCLNKFHRI